MAKTEDENSDQRFPLMDLILELRASVYECVFENLADSIIPPFLSTVQSLEDYLRPQLRSTLALFHTNKTLRAECIEFYPRLAKSHSAELE